MSAHTLPTGWRAWLPGTVIFQLCWFGAVLGAAKGQAWLGPVMVAAAAAWFLSRAPRPGPEILLALSAGVLGLGFEMLPYTLGWISYTGHAGVLVPLWMVALWVNFALVMNTVMRPLRERVALMAALGAIGGPLAYWGGANLGAATWNAPLAMLVYLAIGWGCLAPALGLVATRLDGYRHA